MKVFVAGATGVIGRRAVAQLIGAGHDVSALARSPEKEQQLRLVGALPVSVSMFDADAVRDAIRGQEVVINLATHIPRTSKALRAKAWAENDRIRSEGAGNLVDAAIAAHAERYIQESIAFLYTDHGDDWIAEDAPQVMTPYTAGVEAAEGHAARFTSNGGAAVVLRFGMFYAPDAHHSIDQLRYARRWGFAAMPGEANAYQPLIAADDAARAVVAALDAPAGIYNVVDDDPITRAEWAEVMAAAVGKKRLRLAPRFVNSFAKKKLPSLVSSQRVSNKLFERATGWHPEYPSYREGIATLVEDASATGADTT